MATAPCLFNRPPGTELVRKGKILEGHDFAACNASREMKQSKSHPPLYLKFLTDQPQYAEHSRAQRVKVGEEIRYHYWLNLEVVAIDQFGKDRAHLLCKESSATTTWIIIENYSFTHKKGDFWEFAELYLAGSGATYLIDPNRAFPLDYLNTGLVIHAHLTEQVDLQDLTKVLRERGYKLATVEKELEYKWFSGSHCICLNNEGELIGAELAGRSAYRITAEELPVLPEHYLLLEKLPVVNGQVAA